MRPLWAAMRSGSHPYRTRRISCGMSNNLVSTETWMLLRLVLLVLLLAGFAATLGLTRLLRRARR
jgi:hypothetical protein